MEDVVIKSQPLPTGMHQTVPTVGLQVVQCHIRVVHRVTHCNQMLAWVDERRISDYHIAQPIAISVSIQPSECLGLPRTVTREATVNRIGTRQISHVVSGARDNLQLRCSVATLKRRLHDADRMRKRIKVEIHNTRQTNKALAAVVSIAALSGGFRRCTC